MLTAKNGICSDINKAMVSDKDRCKHASKAFGNAPFREFSSSSGEPDFPEGCFLYVSQKSIYWNPVKTGKRNAKCQAICMNSGM